MKQKSHTLKQTVTFIIGSPPCDSMNQEYYISIMSKANDSFQTVFSNQRPLFYLFQFGESEANECGGWDNAKQIFHEFRNKVMNAGFSDPYLGLLFSFHSAYTFTICCLIF